jgi:hypothetical protein
MKVLPNICHQQRFANVAVCIQIAAAALNKDTLTGK